METQNVEQQFLKENEDNIFEKYKWETPQINRLDLLDIEIGVALGGDGGGFS